MLLTDCTWSLCFVTNQLYLEFMFCYSQIAPGVYVLLLTDCTWSLCFVTHKLYRVYILLYTDCIRSLCFVINQLYQEFMFCYLPIVPAVYVLLLNNCTGRLSFVTHRIIRVNCCIWYVYEPDPIPVKFSHTGNELYMDIRMFGYYHHICMHNTPPPPTSTHETKKCYNFINAYWITI